MKNTKNRPRTLRAIENDQRIVEMVEQGMDNPTIGTILPELRKRGMM